MSEHTPLPAQEYPRVFISHSSVDNEFGKQLHDALARRLLDVWYDKRGGLKPGDEFWPNIVAQLKARPVFLVIVSPDSMRSAWVRDEVAVAFGQKNRADSTGKLIIPILYRPCEQQWGLEILESVTFYSPATFDAGTDALVDRITTYRPLIPTDETPEERLLRLGFEYRESQGVRYLHPPLCNVLEGQFRMGSGTEDASSHPDESPQTWIPTGRYAICKYPLTIAEFRLYAESQNSEVVDQNPARTSAPRVDFPVASISWDAAWEYAHWLSDITGDIWRLPTEAEWEKAARWDPRTNVSTIYPWGNTFEFGRCNSSETYTGGVTPVGAYPSGGSPSQVQDMAGNVSEWTSSAFAEYPYDLEDGRESYSVRALRVCRGGSWQSSNWDVRSACRSETQFPTARAQTIGVRLVWQPDITHR